MFLVLDSWSIFSHACIVQFTSDRSALFSSHLPHGQHTSIVTDLTPAPLRGASVDCVSPSKRESIIGISTLVVNLGS